MQPTKIEVLAHRGLWRLKDERNTRPAIQAALAAGFGIETDIRDFQGELVISHDPPKHRAFTLQQLLADYVELHSQATLALNIKADGLTEPTRELLSAFSIQRYFVFDMSVPDMLAWRRAGMRFFTRQSELEPSPALYDHAAGVWLDAFDGTWFNPATIEAHLAAGKDVCVVSPELHGREPLPIWDHLKKVRLQGAARLILCTDLPHQWLAACDRDTTRRVSA